MNRNLVIFLLSLLAFSGCREKEIDMTVVQETLYDGATINAITAEDAWNVAVVQDERTYVELEYSAFLEDYLRVVMEAHELKIGFSRYLNLPSNTVMHATVHTSSVETLHFAEAVKATLQGEFSGDFLTITLEDAVTCKGGTYHGDGAVSIKLNDASTMVDFEVNGRSCSIELEDASIFKGDLSVTDHLDIVVSDASHLTTYGGHAPQAEVEVSSASSLNLLETEVVTMNITLKDASEASVFVTNTLEGTVQDSSNLYYKGNPSLNIICDETSIIRPL